MTAASWYAWLALRRRVSMSAIGSVIVMACGASLAAVPRALGLGDLARGLSAIVEGPRPSQPSQARVEPLDEAMELVFVTRNSCARRGAPLRGPSPAGRSGTGRTCGR